jgi:glycosyltransferase involved in cell wall biosynthesis
MVAVLEALAERCDLTVLFCSQTGTRAMAWKFVDLPFRHEIVGGVRIGREDQTDLYISPRILTALARSRPEVVISGGFSFPSLYAAAYTRARGAGLVIHSDGTARSEATITWPQRLTRRLLARTSDAAAGNSLQATERFMSLGWPSDRVFAALHTTQIEPFHAVGRARRPSPHQHLVLLHVGRLIPRKGVDRLIRAAAAARAEQADVRLEIVGSGPTESDLRRLAEELDVPTTWHGFVDQDGLPDYYAAADAFAFPTLEDPFGIVLLEAAAAGLPLVASPHGGATGDLVKEGQTGFVVEPDDLRAHARALVTLARDPELRSRMGRAAHELTLNRTPDAAADQYLVAAQAAHARHRKS